MTHREREALQLVGRGLTTAQIARRMAVGRGTVDQMLGSATRKLGAASRLQAAAMIANALRLDASVPATAIDPDGTSLLALLLQGRSLGEAAPLLHLSRRTADRRLAAARVALGVATTAEALLAFQERPGPA
jgi:DNA-binding CsgD family transcriptional regulator